jgi:hypothetical protein
MSIRPKLMSGTDLDDAVTAAARLLGYRGRYGEFESTTERELERLLDEATKEQVNRRAIAASTTPVGPSREEA